jgi:hypothetical protein
VRTWHRFGTVSNSVTRWINKGLRQEAGNPEFSKRLDDLDAAISRES